MRKSCLRIPAGISFPLMHRLAFILGIFWASAAFAQSADAPLIKLDELTTGMKGEVWTVFRGTKPEPFEVEVTGVVRNALGPGKSLILCQLTDERVQKMGAVAGMSGSPLYVEGKLAGALSYQVQKFETVRYAGFTPIGDLLEVGEKSVVFAAQQNHEAGSLTRVQADANDGFRPLSPVFAFGGVAPRVVDWLKPQFAAHGLQVSALGGSTVGNDGTLADTEPLRAGDAVAVAIASGDITLAATGTVSYVSGDQVVAFGHPMLSLGNVSLPMARAEIVTILPSNESSLKVANTGEIIGTIDQDRLSAVAGRLGPGPEMIPVEITIASGDGPTRSLNFRAVRHPQLTPLAIGTGAAQAVLGSNDAGLANGARLVAEFEFEGDESVSTEMLFGGAQGVLQGLGDFARDVSALLQNPYASVFPSAIRVNVTPLEKNPVTTLEYVQLARNAVPGGGTQTVTVGWRDFQGQAGREIVNIPIDPAWQGKQLDVVITNGSSLDQMTGRNFVATSAQLRSFPAYLDFVRRARSAEGLYVAVVESSRVFIDQSVESRDLPDSVARIAQRADQNRYQNRVALNAIWETRALTDRLVPGLLRKSFRVED